MASKTTIATVAYNNFLLIFFKLKLFSETVSISSLSIIRYHFQGLVSGKYKN